MIEICPSVFSSIIVCHRFESDTALKLWILCHCSGHSGCRAITGYKRSSKTDVQILRLCYRKTESLFPCLAVVSFDFTSLVWILFQQSQTQDCILVGSLFHLDIEITIPFCLGWRASAALLLWVLAGSLTPQLSVFSHRITTLTVVFAASTSLLEQESVHWNYVNLVLRFD